MPKVSTLTQIANKALSSLGLKTVDDITTGLDNSSVVCRTHIYDAIEECCDKFRWQELRVTAQLGAAAEDSADGISQWNLPNDFLYLVKIIDDNDALWQIEKDKLVYSASTAPTIVYIGYSESVSQYKVNLFKCIWTRLAADIAMALIEDPQIWQKAEVLAERTWVKETGRSAQKNKSGRRNWRGNTWNNSRRGSTWSGFKRETTPNE